MYIHSTYTIHSTEQKGTRLYIRREKKNKIKNYPMSTFLSGYKLITTDKKKKQIKCNKNDSMNVSIYIYIFCHLVTQQTSPMAIQCQILVIVVM